MKKITLFIILLILATSVIYMNRAYAYIYDEIHNVNLRTPEKNQAYIIGNNANFKNLTYVALGDSLTAGAGTDNFKQSYAYLIAEKLVNKNNIIFKNRSELGYKSIDLINVMLPQVIADKPDIITLLIGVNDIHSLIPKEEFKKNYQQILETLTKETKSKIYLINIPFIGADNLILPPYNYYFDFQTKEFNKVIKDLANQYNLRYIDIYYPTATEFKKANLYYSKDLFHPSAEGYAFWANTIYANFDK